MASKTRLKVAIELLGYLVKGWEDVVSELDFSDRGGASSGHSDSEGDNTLLGDWRVEDSVLALNTKHQFNPSPSQ